MNAEKALNDRQSRDVRGLAKLNAKIMKIAELMMTSDQSPYADGSSISNLVKNHVGGSVMTLMLVVSSAVTSMSAVKQM
jgi:hypothetical protein